MYNSVVTNITEQKYNCHPKFSPVTLLLLEIMNVCLGRIYNIKKRTTFHCAILLGNAKRIKRLTHCLVRQ